MRYIYAEEDFINSMFNFEKGKSYEILSEELDAFVFLSTVGHADQISKNYLKDQPQLKVIED
jgi:hypothetical protein